MSNCPEIGKRAGVFLDVDGASVPLNAFAQKIFGNTVLGMVASLKGIKKDPSRITLTLVRKERDDDSV